MRRSGALLLTILVLSGSVAYGDTSPLSNKCIAPLKQTQFATQFQLDSYRAAVDLYRSCLEAFVKEQEGEIENHRQAAQNAIDEWNRFVGKETKGAPSAPKDKGGSRGATKTDCPCACGYRMDTGPVGGKQLDDLPCTREASSKLREPGAHLNALHNLRVAYSTSRKKRFASAGVSGTLPWRLFPAKHFAGGPHAIRSLQPDRREHFAGLGSIVEAFNEEAYREIVLPGERMAEVRSAWRRVRSPRQWPARIKSTWRGD